MSALDGGFLTLAITNGGTAPSAQAVGRILIAHKDTGGSMPSAGAEGTGDGDWKQVYEIGGGTVSGFKTRLPPWRFGPEVSYIEVEFPPHTGADVTIEAIVSGYTY